MYKRQPQPLARPAVDRLEIIADTYLSLSSPTQWAFPTLFSQRDELQPQIMERVRGNWAFLKTEAGAASCCELLDMEGGWYAILRTQRDEPDEDLAIEILREAGVLIHPGHFYDFPADGCIVLSLITPVEAWRCGVHKLLNYLK